MSVLKQEMNSELTTAMKRINESLMKMKDIIYSGGMSKFYMA